MSTHGFDARRTIIRGVARRAAEERKERVPLRYPLKPNARYDLFKDQKGNIYVKPKGGGGPGDPTGLNINDY